MNLRRAGALVGLLLLTQTPVGVAGVPAHVLSDAQEAYLRDHGPVRVLLGATGAPLTFLDADGRPKGLQVDLLSLMTVRAGIEFNVSVSGNISALTQALRSGERDLVGPTLQLDDATDLAYSDVYYTAPIGFWTNDQHPNLRSVDQLAGLRVATTSAGFQRYLHQKYPDMDVILIDGPHGGALSLSKRNFDALYAGYSSVGYWSRALGITNIRPFAVPEQFAETRWAMRANDTMLAGIVSAAMAAISKDERLQLDYKWTGLDSGALISAASIPFYKSTVFRAIAGGALVVAGALLAWVVALRSQVDRRTRTLRDRELELQARTRDLQNAMQELEMFNHSVSHDLRTPLRTINGFSNILAARPDLPDDERTQYLGILRDESERVAATVNALLELSRTSQRAPQRGEVDVSRVSAEILERLRQQEPARDVTLDVEPSIVVTADPGQLRVLLENLLGNAWKFTRKTAGARIEVARHPDRPDTFYVRDNGIGFRADQEGLFLPFRRFHSDADFDGRGIGLATVHRIVLKHGGHVWAASSPGQGATFFIHLPSTVERPADLASEAAAPPQVEPMPMAR